VDLPSDDSTIPVSIMVISCLDIKGDVNAVLHCMHTMPAKKSLQNDPPAVFDFSDEEYMRRLGLLVGICLENSGAHTKLVHTTELAEASLQTESRLSNAKATQKLEKFPLAVIKESIMLFKAKAACFFMYDEARSLIFRYNVDPTKPAKLDQVHVCPVWGVVGEIVKSGKTKIVSDVNDYRKMGQDVFDPEVDCPASLARTRSILCAPIKKPDAYQSVAGAVSIVLERSTARKFGDADIYCLNMLCSHIGALLFGGEAGAPGLIPSDEDMQAIVQMPKTKADGVVRGEEEIYQMIKALCLQHGVPGAGKGVVNNHVSAAMHIQPHWELSEFKEWFTETMDQYYIGPEPAAPDSPMI